MVALFSAAHAEHKGEILAFGAEALAARRLRASPPGTFAVLDPTDWLTELARNTMPWGDGAAGLVTCAADVEPDAREMMFQEGPLGTVLCASEDELSLGEGAYSVYEWIRKDCDGMYEPPDPAAYLGIHVAECDYLEWQGDDGWALNQEAWREEVRRRCIVEFAAIVAEWRTNFFEALLSG